MSKIACDEARCCRPCRPDISSFHRKRFKLFYRLLVARERFPHGTHQPRSGASPPLLSRVRLKPTGNPFLDGLLEMVLPLLPRGPRYAMECTPCTTPFKFGWRSGFALSPFERAGPKLLRL